MFFPMKLAVLSFFLITAALFAESPEVAAVGRGMEKIRDICKYYDLNCEYFPVMNLNDPGKYKAIFIGDDLKKEDYPKLVDYVKNGGFLFKFGSGGAACLTDGTPLKIDRACYTTPLLVDKKHPLFSNPYNLAVNFLDFYEPSNSIVANKCLLSGIHGGKGYSTFCDLPPEWKGLVKGGDLLPWSLPQFEGEHYIWVEGKCGKGRIIMTTQAVLYSIEKGTEEAGIKLMGNILAYAECNIKVLKKIEKSREEMVFSCPFINAFPVIDGMIDEKFWQKAGAKGNFILLKGKEQAKKQTVVYMFYNREGLYIAFDCKDFNAKDIKAKTAKDVVSQSVFNDDCVELFIMPGEQYYHFVLSAGGGRYTALGESLQKLEGWKGAVSRGKYGWTAEFMIPYGTLKTSFPDKGAKWKLNFCREEKDLKENSSWAVLETFHNPDAFGTIEFK